MKPEIEMFECFECGEDIACTKWTTPHPTSPELFQLPAGAWMGQTIVEYEGMEEDDEEEELIVLCSTECVETFFKAHDEETAEEEPH